jgi:hypothetical protein
LPKCPHCNAPGQRNLYFATVERPDGSLGSRTGYASCRTCQGTNEVTQERLVAITQGKAIRDHRVHVLRLSLRERAKQLGMSPSDYSHLEQGDDRHAEMRMRLAGEMG